MTAPKTYHLRCSNAAASTLLLGLVLLVFASVLAPDLAGLQDNSTATVATDENFRGAPNGVLLGRLSRGTELQSARIDGDWVETTLEGWVWSRSLQVVDEAGFNLVVSEAEGENLRAAPQGNILGRLEASTYLEELERRPGWIRVRRRGWIWRPSVQLESAPTPRSSLPAPASPSSTEDWTEIRTPNAAILSNPDGDTLALAGRGTELRVISREGSWARVRMDGWVWLPSTGLADGADEDSILEGLDPDALAEDPDSFIGRLVTISLRYVSLERADGIRSDFYVGEPFLLTRVLGGGEAFIYVAVPPERLAEVSGLMPLEQFEIVGRVRTGASALTGAPILDLLEFRRRGRNELP